MQDAVLLKTLRQDPGVGMKLLMEQYAGLIYSVVRGKLLTPPFSGEDIEDCVADVILEFYDGLARFDPAKGSIRAWLCTIARNRAVDRVRTQYAAPDTVPLGDVPLSVEGDSPEGELLRREEWDRLLNALRGLERVDREIIFRKYYLSQPSREIAERMGLTVSNVDTRAHRAIRKLRTRLEAASNG